MIGSQARILVVDDDPVFRAIAAEALSAVTPHLFEAEDGQAALRMLSEGRFDLVLTDINMPRRDGLELIGDIRRQWPDTVVIAITGGSPAAAPDLLLKTAGLMGARVLAKPVRPAALVESVRGALGAFSEPG